MASEERIQAEKNAVLLDPLMYAVVKDHLTGAFPGFFNTKKKSGCCWCVGRRGLVGLPVLWDLWGWGGFKNCQFVDEKNYVFETSSGAFIRLNEMTCHDGHDFCWDTLF